MPNCEICGINAYRLRSFPVASINPLLAPVGVKVKVCISCHQNIKIASMIIKQIRRKFAPSN